MEIPVTLTHSLHVIKSRACDVLASLQPGHTPQSTQERLKSLDEAIAGYTQQRDDYLAQHTPAGNNQT